MDRRRRPVVLTKPGEASLWRSWNRHLTIRWTHGPLEAYVTSLTSERGFLKKGQSSFGSQGLGPRRKSRSVYFLFTERSLSLVSQPLLPYLQGSGISRFGIPPASRDSTQ